MWGRDPLILKPGTLEILQPKILSRHDDVEKYIAERFGNGLAVYRT